MYVVINEETYTAIKNLSFDPQTDLTGESMPINEFYVDIIGAGTIAVGQYAFLYDDLDNLWAKYWIIFAERIDEQTVRVQAQSTLKLLERDMLPAIMYNAVAVESILPTILASVGAGNYVLDSSFEGVTISGFCPEQSAKTRLQWICFCLGAYVKTYFSDKIEILPLDDVTTEIPMDKTFWKPSLTYRDYVTGINVVGYSFIQGTPQTTEEWVTDGTNYYIVTPTKYRLGNPNVPSGIASNEITFEGIYIVNADNVSSILANLGAVYFKRLSISADVINNAEYEAGQLIDIHTNEEDYHRGYIQACTFSFGVQARAQLQLLVIESFVATKLIINYIYDNTNIGKKTYFFPVGYTYSIENPFVDILTLPHRYVYRPLNVNAEGTIVEGTNVNNQQYEVALHYYYEDNVLLILSVSGVSTKSGDTEVVVIE